MANGLFGGLFGGNAGTGNSWMTPEMQRQQQMQALSGLSQGLLAASAPSRMPVSFGQAMGAGMQGMQQGQDAYMDRVYKQAALQKAMQPDLPQGYRFNEQTGQAELTPGVDPSFGKRADFSSMMPVPVYDPKTGQLTYAPRSQVAGGGFQPPEAAPPSAKPPKPMPPAALKLQTEALDAIGTSSKIDADMGQIIKTIDEGKLPLGPLSNLTSSAKNYMGLSDEGSRNFATFKAELERMRNESLRLNKGVQTEGDSQRAWNEILASINDPELVKQRLAEVQQINRRGAQLKQLEVDQIRANYGNEPLDTSEYTDTPAAILGGKATPPASKAAQPQPNDPYAKARAAIQSGADPGAVKKRLVEAGYDPAQLGL
jgi:hypothetical protein